MNVPTLTDWNMSIRSDRKLPYDTLRGNLGLLEMTYHLGRSRLMRAVGGSDLNGMVFRLIWSDRFDVCCDLTILQLQQKKHAWN